jgi:hypothetical protein
MPSSIPLHTRLAAADYGLQDILSFIKRHSPILHGRTGRKEEVQGRHRCAPGYIPVGPQLADVVPEEGIQAGLEQQRAHVHQEHGARGGQHLQPSSSLGQAHKVPADTAEVSGFRGM